MKDNPLQIALHQFNQVADKINLDPAIRNRLAKPKRSFIVSIPIRMDDGRVEVFEGYRVHHTVARGPAKGGYSLPS
jgi:glutamate dehydrogenase (NAD(P)+)